MAQAKETISSVCSLKSIRVEREWIMIPMDTKVQSNIIITMGRECRERASIAVNADIHELIQTNTKPEDVIIFTDGSVMKEINKSGWGFSARVEGKVVMERSEAYNITTSSMRMEEIAVTAALQWVSSTMHKGMAIVMDSQSILRKIQSGWMKPEWLEAINKSRLARIAWIFTPGHAGVCGNERADQMARVATISPNYTMGEMEILAVLLGAHDEDTDSDTVRRLHELGIDQGSGQKCARRGRARNIMNQTAMGTISRPTLSFMLERGAECLWAFPQHDDANS